MKRRISAVLVVALSAGLLGFNPLKVQAQELTLSAVTDLDVASLPKPEKTPDITAGELAKLKTSDPNRMVRVIVELSADSVVETATKSNQRVKDLGKSKIATLETTIVQGQKTVKDRLLKKIKFQDRLTGKKDAGQQLTIAVNGFSTFMRLGDLELAQQTEGIANVFIANEYYRPTMNTSVDMIDAPEAWSTYGMKGEGTVVAIIDSGIDPTHKDMRLDDLTVPALLPETKLLTGLPGIFFTEKVPYGYNYYDLNTNIKDHGDSGHHGMHVAGTVAANGEIKGVAPEAQLLAMKVFSDDILYATTFSDIYIKAMDDAVKLGADVVNMSLGSPAGFYVPDSIEDVAISHARDNGVTVAISAGNERNMMDGAGKTNQAKNPDNGVVGSPSVNSGSLSVASVENAQILGNYMTYTIGGLSATAMILPSSGSPVPWEVYTRPMELVDVGFGGLADFTGKDLDGKITLIERGQNSFTDMLAWSTAAKASGVLVFNSQAGGESMISMAGGDGAKIPHIFTGRTAGLAIKAALTGKQSITVTFPREEILFGNPLGGTLSSFSSWGTPPDLKLKPEISAPGGMIYSTQNDNEYTVMSGTSMAAPHVSGAAALVAQRIDTDLDVFFRDKSNLVKTLLMNTAIPYKDGSGLYYDTRQQGAGLLNVANALESSVTVTDAKTNEPKVELLDFNTAYFDVELTLKNYDDEARSFTTATILLTDDYVSDGQGHYLAAERTQAVKHTANAPRSIVVPANGTTTVKFRVNFAQAFGSNPTNSLTKNQYLGGFIRFLSSDDKNSDLTVPVLGFYGDWDAPNVLDEMRWNLADNKTTNDPEFDYTTLVNPGAAGDLFFADTRTDIWINPTSEASFKEIYGTHQLGLLGTLLRNAEKITYRVKDAGGNTLRTIGQSGYARKIFRLAQGVPPYSFFEESVWDGTIAGRNFAEGEKVFYDIEIQRTASAEPEIYSFPVRFDNVGPVISNVVYDPASQTVSMDLADAGSGVGSVDIISNDYSTSVSAEYKGSKRFVLDVSKLRLEEDTDVYIMAYDNIFNYNLGMLKLPGTGTEPETPPSTTTPSTTTPSTTTPSTTSARPDDAYGKPQIVLYSPDLLEVYSNPFNFKGVVYGWENIDQATVTMNGLEEDLVLTKREKSSALDPEGNELFYGNTWTFDQNFTLADGYHELPITIYNGDTEASFNIVRRFWVDTTPPVIDAAYKITKGKNATITLTVTDNLYYLEIYQGDSLLSQDSWDDRGFDTKNISITHTIPVTLTKGTNTFTFKAIDAGGNETLHTLEITRR